MVNMASQLYLHFKGTAIARERGLGNSRQESQVDQWVPSKAPEGAVSQGQITLDNEMEIFHKVVDLSTRVAGFVNIHIGADVDFKGVIEIFKSS